MNLSVITAAIPSLHRVLHDLQHGALGTRITEGQYELSLGGKTPNSHSLASKIGLSKSSGLSPSDPKLSTSYSTNSHSHSHSSHHDHPASRISNRIFSDQSASSHSVGNRGGGNSQANDNKRNDRSGLEENSPASLTQKNGVMQTWEISVEVEDGDQVRKEEDVERSEVTRQRSGRERSRSRSRKSGIGSRRLRGDGRK